MSGAPGKFRVSASGYVTIDIDCAELFAAWRNMIDAKAAKGQLVDASYGAFCDFADEAISDDVCEQAAESVWFEIESGPSAESLLTIYAFRALCEPNEDADSAALEPIKGQLDIFGGEHA